MKLVSCVWTKCLEFKQSWKTGQFDNHVHVGLGTLLEFNRCMRSMSWVCSQMSISQTQWSIWFQYTYVRVSSNINILLRLNLTMCNRPKIYTKKLDQHIYVKLWINSWESESSKYKNNRWTEIQIHLNTINKLRLKNTTSSFVNFLMQTFMLLHFGLCRRLD